MPIVAGVFRSRERAEHAVVDHRRFDLGDLLEDFFESAEEDYRRGFETALRENNGAASATPAGSEAFRHGYERGIEYCQRQRTQ